MSATSLIACHDRFLIFLDRENQKTKSDKGHNAAERKKWYVAARALLDPKKKPEPEQMKLLSSLDPNQLEIVSDYLGLDAKELGKLKAAINDSKLPASARPRIVRQKL